MHFSLTSTVHHTRLAGGLQAGRAVRRQKSHVRQAPLVGGSSDTLQSRPCLRYNYLRGFHHRRGPRPSSTARWIHNFFSTWERYTKQVNSRSSTGSCPECLIQTFQRVVPDEVPPPRVITIDVIWLVVFNITTCGHSSVDHLMPSWTSLTNWTFGDAHHRRGVKIYVTSTSPLACVPLVILPCAFFYNTNCEDFLFLDFVTWLTFVYPLSIVCGMTNQTILVMVIFEGVCSSARCPLTCPSRWWLVGGALPTEPSHSSW